MGGGGGCNVCWMGGGYYAVQCFYLFFYFNTVSGICVSSLMVAS